MMTDGLRKLVFRKNTFHVHGICVLGIRLRLVELIPVFQAQLKKMKLAGIMIYVA